MEKCDDRSLFAEWKLLENYIMSKKARQHFFYFSKDANVEHASKLYIELLWLDGCCTKRSDQTLQIKMT